jgi:uncharacterized protein with PQ loop repeat
MSTVSLLALVAGTWGVLMSVAPLLQIRTMIRARSAEGVSLGYLRVLLVGFVLWFAYGVALGDPALMVCNALSAMVGATTIGVASHYRRIRSTPTPPVLDPALVD